MAHIHNYFSIEINNGWGKLVFSQSAVMHKQTKKYVVMKNQRINFITLILAVIIFSSYDLPEKWFKAGSKPKSYHMGIDKGAGYHGNNAATIKSNEKKIDGFGTLMQQFKPGKFANNRVKMTGYAKTESVIKSCGLWLRVDQIGTSRPISFDNMADRPILGTTTWTKYEIVLDVPANASLIAFGALLEGTGQIWFDNISFEIVDNSVPVTGKINNASQSAISEEPLNLDFDE